MNVEEKIVQFSDVADGELFSDLTGKSTGWVKVSEDDRYNAVNFNYTNLGVMFAEDCAVKVVRSCNG